jgi:SWI/SNF-related matrix-associated actin-dependent regulator of chromatin subfamily A3
MVEGILTGVIGTYDCPLKLRLYATRNPVEQEALKRRMKQDRFPVQIRPPNRAAQAKRDRIRKEAMKRGNAEEAGRQDSYTQAGRSQEAINPATLEDLINQSSTFNPRQMGQAVEKFGINESDLASMPMADTPSSMKTQLLSYQRQGLAWMLAKEAPSLPEQGSPGTVQLWKRESSRYKNIATHFATSQPPTLASGGILADDMGLGKTIQIISLIMANSKPRTPQSSSITLIISPVGVMSNWKGQIEAHVKPEHIPKILVYHGTNKKGANLTGYDVVITSYGALASEYTQFDGPPVKRSLDFTPLIGVVLCLMKVTASEILDQKAPSPLTIYKPTPAGR